MAYSKKAQVFTQAPGQGLSEYQICVFFIPPFLVICVLALVEYKSFSVRLISEKEKKRKPLLEN